MVEFLEGYIIDKNEIEDWDLFEVCVCDSGEPIDLGDKIFTRCYHAKKGNYEEFGGKWVFNDDDDWCYYEYLEVKCCENANECEQLRKEWEDNNGCDLKVLKDVTKEKI